MKDYRLYGVSNSMFKKVNYGNKGHKHNTKNSAIDFIQNSLDKQNPNIKQFKQLALLEYTPVYNGKIISIFTLNPGQTSFSTTNIKDYYEN